MGLAWQKNPHAAQPLRAAEGRETTPWHARATERSFR
jgi:hypothetical protein